MRQRTFSRETLYNRLFNKQVYKLESYNIDELNSRFTYATLSNKETGVCHTVKGVRAERLVYHHLFKY